MKTDKIYYIISTEGIYKKPRELRIIEKIKYKQPMFLVKLIPRLKDYGSIFIIKNKYKGESFNDNKYPKSVYLYHIKDKKILLDKELSDVKQVGVADWADIYTDYNDAKENAIN